MSVFAASSALVKLYADEEGHEAIRSLQAIAASAIARVEVPAALWRKQRLGEIDAADASTLVEGFEADFLGDADEPPRFAVVGLAMPVLGHAAARAAAHGLRAYDAVQLASGLAARQADPECDRFACFDEELRSAAAQSGFELIPGASNQPREPVDLQSASPGADQATEG